MSAVLSVFFVVLGSLLFGWLMSEFKNAWDDMRAEDGMDAHEAWPGI